MHYESDRREVEATDVFDVVYSVTDGSGKQFDAPASDLPQPDEPQPMGDTFDDDEF